MATVHAEPAFDVAALLARERGALLATLQRLDARDWERRTPCPGWSVRDLVSHVWCTDLHVLARLRDGYLGEGVAPDAADRDAITMFVNEHNQRWVAATRGLSPRVLLDRLQESGPQVTTVFRVSDPSRPAETVAWAGPEPQPLWFCGARELTERFVHQQQIRAAVDQPPFDDVDVLGAVVDTFAAAFPAALDGAAAEPGTTVAVEVTGAVGRRWSFTRATDGWRAAGPADGWRPGGPVDADGAVAAGLRADADAFWRLLAGAMTPAEQVHRVELTGTPTLFAALRDTRAVLV